MGLLHLKYWVILLLNLQKEREKKGKVDLYCIVIPLLSDLDNNLDNFSIIKCFTKHCINSFLQICSLVYISLENNSVLQEATFTIYILILSPSLISNVLYLNGSFVLLLWTKFAFIMILLGRDRFDLRRRRRTRRRHRRRWNPYLRFSLDPDAPFGLSPLGGAVRTSWRLLQSCLKLKEFRKAVNSNSIKLNSNHFQIPTLIKTMCKKHYKTTGMTFQSND